MSIPERKSNLFFFLIFIVVSFAIFGNGIAGGFVYDDEWAILGNPSLAHLSGIPSQLVSSYHYLQPETGLYRPLTLISYSLNFIFGKSPAGFHIVNILLHATNVFLIFLLIKKLKGAQKLALLISGIFLLLPIHVEAVTFISGRADLLAFFFSLLTLLAVIERRYWLGSVLFLGALGAKESALALVPIIAWYLLVWERLRWKVALRKAIIFIPPIIIYGLFRYGALGKNFLANDASYIYNPLKFTDPLSRFFTALKVMVLLIGKTFVPLHFSADYSYNQVVIIGSLWNGYAAIGLAVITGLLALILWPRTRSLLVTFGGVIFLSSYLVISNFIFPIGTIMAERTLYLPSLGLSMMAGLVIYLVIARRKYLWLLLVPLGSVYAIRTIDRNRVWHDPKTFFEAMAHDAPMSAHTKTTLAIEELKADQWEDGERLLKESYAIAPEHLPTLNSLGLAAEHFGRVREAEDYYHKALTLRPNYINALLNLGRFSYDQKKYSQSAEMYQRAFIINQKSTYLIGYLKAQYKQARYHDGLAFVNDKASQLISDPQVRLLIGYGYFQLGDRAQAAAYFKGLKDEAISDAAFVQSIKF